VRNVIRNHACWVTRLTTSVLVVLVARSLTLKQGFHVSVQRLCPELFVGLEHVALTDDSADLTGGHITDVDTLVLIERDHLASLQDFKLDVGDEITRAVDHPSVTSAVSLAIRALLSGHGLSCKHEQCLTFAENIHILNTMLHALSRVKEEAALTLAQLAGTKAVETSLGIAWVKNNAELTVGESLDVDDATDGLADVRNV